MPAAVMHSATVAQSAIVTDCSAIGFVASALVLAAFGMKDMVNLRIVAICSNVAFITYAVMLNLPPILTLHVILLPLNGWRLAQELRRRGWSNRPTNDSKPADSVVALASSLFAADQMLHGAAFGEQAELNSRSVH